MTLDNSPALMEAASYCFAKAINTADSRNPSQLKTPDISLQKSLNFGNAK